MVYGLIMLHPELRGRLPRALSCIRGWKKVWERVEVHYPPMLWRVAVVVAVAEEEAAS